MSRGEPAGRSVLPLIGVLAATAMSVTANSVVAIAVPWLVLERTGSAGLAGGRGDRGAGCVLAALIAGVSQGLRGLGRPARGHGTAAGFDHPAGRQG